MTTANHVSVRGLSSSAQIARGLVLLRRRMHLGEKPRSVEFHKLSCVSPIRLNPFPTFARDERRSHHHTRRAFFADPPLQRVPARSGLVAEPHAGGRLAQRLLHHASHRCPLIRALPLHGLPLARDQHRYRDRHFVRIHTHERGGNLPHDRLLSYAALAPQPWH